MSSDLNPYSAPSLESPAPISSEGSTKSYRHLAQVASAIKLLLISLGLIMFSNFLGAQMAKKGPDAIPLVHVLHIIAVVLGIVGEVKLLSVGNSLRVKPYAIAAILLSTARLVGTLLVMTKPDAGIFSGLGALIIFMPVFDVLTVVAILFVMVKVAREVDRSDLEKSFKSILTLGIVAGIVLLGCSAYLVVLLNQLHRQIATGTVAPSLTDSIRTGDVVRMIVSFVLLIVYLAYIWLLNKLHKHIQSGR